MSNSFNQATSAAFAATSLTSIMSDSTNKKLLINLNIANSRTSSGEVTVDVAVKDGSTYNYILRNAAIPYGSSLNVDLNGKLVLLAGQTIWAKLTSGSDSVDFIISYLDDVS